MPVGYLIALKYKSHAIRIVTTALYLSEKLSCRLYVVVTLSISFTILEISLEISPIIN